MSDIIKTANAGSAFSITIDRGAEGNALTIELLRALAAAFREGAKSDAKVIVLRTAGKDFCIGRDPRGGAPSPTALAMRSNLIAPILDVYDAISNAQQPVICAVQGAALGFGCALATACDVTVAADVARFRLPELEKNLPPTLAVSAMMKQVPLKALTWLVYSMEEVDSRTALALGIVSKVVPAAELTAATDRIVAALTERSREALVAVKDYLRVAPGMEGRGAAELAGNMLATVFSSAAR